MNRETRWLRLFERLHACPELSFRETETTRIIRDVLEEDHIEILPTDLPTGLIAHISGGTPGKRVCLRADIDALPIAEETNLPYASRRPQVMHACGHDFHITAALAAASVLRQIQEQLHGTLYLAFEPGEEAGGGAQRLLDSGALPELDEVYGFHADPGLEPGTAGIRAGGLLAAVDRFRIDADGRSAHAALPHLGHNPVTALASLAGLLPQMAAQAVPSGHPHVLTVTRIEGGSAWNVIPSTALCEGTVRTLYPEDRKAVHRAFSRLIQGFGAGTDIPCRLQWTGGAAAVVNDPGLCRLAYRAAEAAGIPAVEAEPQMVSDDFSDFSVRFPQARTLYVQLGVGRTAPLHHPRFQIAPQAIAPAASFLTALLRLALSPVSDTVSSPAGA